MKNGRGTAQVQANRWLALLLCTGMLASCRELASKGRMTPQSARGNQNGAQADATNYMPWADVFVANTTDDENEVPWLERVPPLSFLQDTPLREGWHRISSKIPATLSSHSRITFVLATSIDQRDSPLSPVKMKVKRRSIIFLVQQPVRTAFRTQDYKASLWMEHIRMDSLPEGTYKVFVYKTLIGELCVGRLE